LKMGGEAETSCLDAGISAGSVVAWISLNSSPKTQLPRMRLLHPRTPWPS
jgi:hypothetical protein